jgi:hypothetical protein
MSESTRCSAVVSDGCAEADKVPGVVDIVTESTGSEAVALLVGGGLAALWIVKGSGMVEPVAVIAVMGQSPLSRAYSSVRINISLT